MLEIPTAIWQSKLTMPNQPYEVWATRHLHAELIIAAHAALEAAMDVTPKAACPEFEQRVASTLGHNMNVHMHNVLATRLGSRVAWFSDRGFIALLEQEKGVAMRLGSCDVHGRPRDTEDRTANAPFTKFIEGSPLLFADSELRTIFCGYSVRRIGQDDMEVDRVVLAKYEGKEHEHVWSWGLDPADPGQVQSALRGRKVEIEVIPAFIPVPRQRRFGGWR